MGMFDNFEPNEKLYCKKCKKELYDLKYLISGKQRKVKVLLQSKALFCLLNLYKQGKELRITTLNNDLRIINGWILAHTNCWKCKTKGVYTRNEFKLIIENGIWTKTIPIK